MKNIAIISFGTGGTMGHMSLTTNISKFLVKKRNRVHLFSEQNYLKFSNINQKFVKFIQIPKQKHFKTVGGCLNYRYKEKLMQMLLENEIDIVIFSTFFDPEIVKFCNSRDMKNILISYPLRDSHRRAIELRGYYKGFEKVFTLKDVIKTTKISSNEIVVLPIKNNKTMKRRVSPLNKVLITCGGGGRPSSKLFFKIIKMVVKNIYHMDKSIKFTIITGNSKQKLNLPNSKVISWSRKFFELLKNHDLLLSEAGYFTMLDMTNAKIPSILIPGERRIDNQELRSLEYQSYGCGYTYFPTEKSEDIVKKIIYLKKNGKIISGLIKNYSKLSKNIFSKTPKLEKELTKFLKS